MELLEELILSIKLKDMIYNLKNILKQILPRKNRTINYILGEGSVLYDTASIINNLGINKVMIGRNCHIRGQLLTFGHGGMIKMGDYCYLGINSFVWSARQIMIGNRVLISHNCNVFDNDVHPLDPVKRHGQFKQIITTGQPQKIILYEEKVIIEDDVLIGANSTILKGVTLHKGAVVGAGSVVVKDIPAYTLVIGNPAKPIKQIK